VPIANDSAPVSRSRDEDWPPLPLEEWQDTYDTLHLWTQIVGKLKVELSPFLNHLWHTALHLTARGLTTQPIPFAGGDFEVDFDFVDHNLLILTSQGTRKTIPLYPRSVSSFYEEMMGCLAALGISVEIDTLPQEITDPIPCDQDTEHASYDPEAVGRWWRIVASSARVMWRHRSWFVGKASPVHFYWGAFDLTATRHNGEPASVASGSGYILRVAENEANWAAGFWPGGGPVTYPAYYAYMVPAPEGFAQAKIEPEAAVWNAELGEFLLPYEAVRTADDPEATLMAFLQSSYVAGADLAGWDRERLELKEIPRPR
jgi:Family of unknown function (DUF5996)